MTNVNNTPITDVAASFASQLSSGQRKRIFLRDLLWTRKSSGVGSLIVLLFVLIAIAAPLLAPRDPARQDLTSRYAPPSTEFRLGTDNFGRDMLSRVIWGSRISLSIGVIAVSISIVIGGGLGIISGYFGGRVDQFINTGIEMLMAFPSLLIALILIAVLGPSMLNLMIAIGLGSVPLFARVLRAEARSLCEREYIIAARSIGTSHLRIIFRHIMPNITASLIILGTTRVATAVLSEASLSFLGIGIQPPTASWGTMIADGRAYLERAPWIALIPGVITMITVMGFNLFGDGLRDVLDVRNRGNK